VDIGCDIIHLEDHWSVDTLRQRRLFKLYVKSELSLLAQIHENPKIAEAVLWSAKETAYKSSYVGIARFIPKQFILNQVLKDHLIIHFKEKLISVAYIIEKEYVFTKTLELAKTIFRKGHSDEYIHIEKTEENESFKVRKNACNYLRNKYGGEWGICKTEFGKPYLIQDNNVSEKKISISHHKPFIAFVLH